jgi:hypothetical protein
MVLDITKTLDDDLVRVCKRPSWEVIVVLVGGRRIIKLSSDIVAQLRIECHIGRDRKSEVQGTTT